eukprot:COSAG02_NODE_2513_length_8624_cov_15.389443_10_plen_72_part_00
MSEKAFLTRSHTFHCGEIIHSTHAYKSAFVHFVFEYYQLYYCMIVIQVLQLPAYYVVRIRRSLVDFPLSSN